MSAPRAMLRRDPGAERLEPAEQEICCGSAGIYNIVEAETAAELGDRKAVQVLATEPGRVRERQPRLPRPGHGRDAPRRRPTPAFHPIELVDASIRGVGVGELLEGARR